VKAGLIAEPVFELLRRDVEFCANVSTVDQAAALEGVSTAKLTAREATWVEEHGKLDFIGPHFPAVWVGSPEEAREQERERNYSEQLSKRLRGE
jgi:hypothetical protein